MKHALVAVIIGATFACSHGGSAKPKHADTSDKDSESDKDGDKDSDKDKDAAGHPAKAAGNAAAKDKDSEKPTDSKHATPKKKSGKKAVITRREISAKSASSPRFISNL